MKRRISSAVRRRIAARSQPGSGQGWLSVINTLLTSIIAVAMLAVTVAQWRTSERQTDISESLKVLEFAKSEAKFHVQPSTEIRRFRAGLSDRQLALPKAVGVTIAEGARELAAIDVPVRLMLTQATRDDAICTLEIRGLYMDNEGNDRVSLWEPAYDDLEPLLATLDAHGFEIIDTEPVARLTYIDLLGRPRVKMYSLSGEEYVGDDTAGVPLLSGAWSGGSGFFSKKGYADTYCSESSADLDEAIAAAGGKSGTGR